MYRKLEGITPPADNDILWRFMSFEKFVDILAKKSLFCTRADKFEDPFEGFMPPSVKKVFRTETNRLEIEEYGPKAKDAHLKLIDNFRKYIMCSCWHHGEQKSMAMWERYRARSNGIAINTTMGSLKKSLPISPHVFIGKVNYINYYQFEIPQNLSEMSMMYAWYFHKRPEYEFEREVRLIIDPDQFISDYFSQQISVRDILEQDAPHICDVGMSLDVEVNTLIGEVVISPYADEWITKTLESVVRQYGFEFPVSRSSLLDPPD